MADPGAGTLLTQKGYAELKGFSKQYVNQLVKAGRIPLVDGKIDPDAADAALARSRDPAKDRTVRAPDAAETPSAAAETGAPVRSSPYLHARTAREVLRARRERIELDEIAGDLVSRRRVRAAALGTGRLARDMMLAGVPAMAQELAAELRIEAAPLAAGLKRAMVNLLERVADSVGEDGHGFDRGVRPTQEPDKGE